LGIASLIADLRGLLDHDFDFYNDDGRRLCCYQGWSTSLRRAFSPTRLRLD